MPSVTNQGGYIYQSDNKANDAGVEQATATQVNEGDTATWVVTLKKVPSEANYTKGLKLTYNSKGTSNPNANNYLEVTQVNGPTKYTCTGNWPMNI